MPRSSSDRSWKFIRSLEWSLLIGALCGMAFIGLTYSQFMLELETRQSIYIGVGIAVVVTAVLTYILDQISKSVGGFRNALRGNRAGNTKEKSE
jgi:Kef-type K+ transport system membrane component KefB